MIFPKKYNALDINIFETNNYKLVPIRYEDRLDIMKWRNEQMYHLRQSDLLTEESQDNYYKNTINQFFNIKQPTQILFSFLEHNELIGYGGLVHINWGSRHAEISFLMDTDLNIEKIYLKLFSIYLKLIERLAKSAGLHKIYTYGFDLDSYRFTPLVSRKFEHEARLKSQKMINGKFVDVLIYGKLL